MRKIVVKDLGEAVGPVWRELQRKYTRIGIFNIASPLSWTSLPIYKWVAEHSGEFEKWDKVRFVLMDELVEGEKAPFRYVFFDDPASYEGFARKHFLDPLGKKVSISKEVVKPDVS